MGSEHSHLERNRRGKDSSSGEGGSKWWKIQLNRKKKEAEQVDRQCAQLDRDYDMLTKKLDIIMSDSRIDQFLKKDQQSLKAAYDLKKQELGKGKGNINDYQD